MTARKRRPAEAPIPPNSVDSMVADRRPSLLDMARSLAEHEAAHAVINVHYGFDLEEVSLIPTETAQCPHVSSFFEPGLEHGRAESMAAGNVWCAMHWGLENHGRTWLYSPEDLASHIDLVGGQDWELSFRAASETALDLLLRPDYAEAVYRLADVLMEREFLNGADAEDIVLSIMDGGS